MNGASVFVTLAVLAGKTLNGAVCPLGIDSRCENNRYIKTSDGVNGTSASG